MSAGSVCIYASSSVFSVGTGSWWMIVCVMLLCSLPLSRALNHCICVWYSYPLPLGIGGWVGLCICVQREYWKLVDDRTCHVAIQSASVVDTDSAANKRRHSTHRWDYCSPFTVWRLYLCLTASLSAWLLFCVWINERLLAARQRWVGLCFCPVPFFIGLGPLTNQKVADLAARVAHLACAPLQITVASKNTLW